MAGASWGAGSDSIRTRGGGFLNVGVRQDAVFGSVFLLGTDFPPCDGRWHRLTVAVAPEAGSFVPGVATVEASLSAFHPTEGDLIVFDTVTVRL